MKKYFADQIDKTSERNDIAKKYAINQIVK